MIALTEVNLGSFNLIDSTHILLRTKLANYDIWIVDLSTYYLTITINACHNIVHRVHVST